MNLTDRQWRTLLALGDTLIPRDAYPSASEAGLRAFVERNSTDFGAELIERLCAGIDGLVELDFDNLPVERQHDVVQRLEADDPPIPWPERCSRWLRTAVEIVSQGYYADAAAGRWSWPMVGFDPAPKRPLPDVEAAPLRTARVDEIRAEYDAIIVGAGAGGGVVAHVLSQAGLDVLLIDRGEALTHTEVGRDHLRNHRFSVYGHNTGPLAGHPRVIVGPAGAREVQPHEAGYSNNAMTVGGGTRVYGAQAWRFAPEDFRMASAYGVPAGSGLADWPIDYDTLAPWYARAECEIGVAGELGHAHHGARDAYPMQPFPLNADGNVLRGAAARLNWRTAAIPIAINTRSYDGRPACVRCGTCVGFSCPSDSRNGTHNTVIPRALASGRCQLLTGAHAESVICDSDAQARAVRFYADAAGRVEERTVRARAIVVAAGAIETARLLLNSRSRAHVQGLGNGFDQVGRYLQGHLYAGAVGLYRETVQDCEGPGVSIATCEFNHGNPGIIGGGMLGNEFVPLPIHFWNSFAPSGPRWGAAAKRAFADAYRRTLVVMGPVQEIPNPDSRMTLDPSVRDRFGIPVARLSGCVHAESVRSAAMLQAKAEQWLRAADVVNLRSWGSGYGNALSAGQHQAGTCRMGIDPRHSVTDREGRVHGQHALYVADGSLHVTNGGFNPVLTIIANAYRIGASLVDALRA